MGLTKILQEKGFIWDVYCQSSKKYSASHVFFYKMLIKNEQSPFVKTSIYRFKNIENVVYPSFRIIKTYANYDINLIKKDVVANKMPHPFLKNPKQFIKAFRKNIIRFSLKNRTLEFMDNEYKF